MSYSLNKTAKTILQTMKKEHNLSSLSDVLIFMYGYLQGKQSVSTTPVESISSIPLLSDSSDSDF